MLKKLIGFLPLLVLVGIVLAYFYVQNNQPLVSPFAGIWHDGTDLINKKITSPLNLDFARSTELDSLSTIPRYIVYNADTGQVYHAKGTTDLMAPASFTKLISTQVDLDLIPLDQVITVDKKATEKIPTILGIKEGEKISAADLLRGAIATSANDAAQALADGAVAYRKLDMKDFTRLMNTKAHLLGMDHSQFVNPDGLDDQRQFTTLEDLTRLIHNVQVNYPEIASAGASDRQDIQKTSDHDRYYLPNWNGLLGVYPGVNGLKIAYTEMAGYSSIVTASESGKHFVAIVSGASSYYERDQAAADLLDSALIAEKMSPKKIGKWALKEHYQKWADLANKIKAELEATKSAAINK